MALLRDTRRKSSGKKGFSQRTGVDYTEVLHLHQKWPLLETLLPLSALNDSSHFH